MLHPSEHDDDLHQYHDMMSSPSIRSSSPSSALHRLAQQQHKQQQQTPLRRRLHQDDDDEGEEVEESTPSSSYVLPFHIASPSSSSSSSSSRRSSYVLSFLSRVKSALPSSFSWRDEPPPGQMHAPLNGSSSSSSSSSTWHALFMALRRDYTPESSWLILSLLGSLMSVASWIIDEVIDSLHDVRNDIGKLPKKLGDRNQFLASLDDTTSLTLWWLWAMFWGLFAVGICRFLSPQAEGLGLEQIRSILGGFALPGYLTTDTMVAKMLGLIAVQAAGVNLGTEGAFVHIACSLGVLLLELPQFSEIKQSRHLQRQVLSAACATGISSIFGSPVGGVLFAIEITSNVYHTADYWKAFYTAALCKFLYSLLSRFGNARGSQISLFPATFEAQPFLLWEMPLFLVLSMVCGAVGGLFVRAVLQATRFSRAYFNTWAWTSIVITLHAVINWFFGQFMKRSLAKAIGDLLVTGEMVQSGTVSADYHLESLDWGQPGLLLNLIVFCLLNGALFVLSMTLQVPTGTLIPMFAVGMSMGRFCGEFVKLLGLTSAVPAGYALVGASAFVAGCTGATSTAVIVFEMTGQLAFMVPILLAVVVGRAMGEVISPDLYEALQIYKNLPNIPPLSRQQSFAVRTSLLMNANNIPMLPRHCPVDRIRMAVQRSGTNANERGAEDLFAIVTDDLDRFYLSSCTRAQLRHILSTLPERQDEQEEEELTPSPPPPVLVVDLLASMEIGYTAPTCPTNTPAIDLMHLFEQSLAPTIFVTKQSRVVGFVDLHAMRYLIEHHNL